MSEPRGYNPIGQSAPGLPRHDAPLPGHTPGQYQPLGGNDDAGAGGGYGGAYRDPGFPLWFGVWSARFTFFGATYVTLPLQVALYPIAGLAGVVAAVAAFLILRMAGMSVYGARDWTWTVCFLALIALMRTEIRTEGRIPGYRAARQALRLAICFGGMLYVAMHDQGEPLSRASIASGIFTAIVFFVLRSRLMHGLWNSLQSMSWMRPAGG